mgnify:CR=1 FL=1
MAAELLGGSTVAGDRRVVCEPNVLLVGAAGAFAVDGVPASTNLVVPPYSFESENVVVIGVDAEAA